MRNSKTDNNSGSIYSPSNLWKKLGNDLFDDVDSIDLDNFRSPGQFNNRLASWDPYDKISYRYYKNILFNLVSSMDDRFFEYYKKIGATNLGNPIEVIVKGQSFNFDYVFSVQEVIFCEKILNNVSSIVEVGSGFGRTCHAILNNFSNITTYTIIDIPEVLDLSKKYLQQVLDKDNYDKINFLENCNAENATGVFYINIDSMQEMDQEVVNNYLSLIDRKGGYFYSRNAVCKYDPSQIGLINIERVEFNNAIATGLCLDVVNIFNSDDLNNARKKYMEKYKPSTSWKLIKQEASFPWQYYHHVLYAK